MTPEPRHVQHIPLAVTYAFIAALMLALMSVGGKIVGEKVSTDTIICSRFAISLIVILPWVLKNPKEVIKVASPKKVVVRSIFTLLGMACFFYALRYISLTDTLLLNNTFPLFVPIVTAVLVKTRTSWKIWGSIVFGFIGVAFILRPDASVLNIASLVGLGSGVFSAIASVIIRLLTKTVSILQILFYNFFIGTVVTAVILPWGWKTPDFTALWYLLGIGITGAIYQYCSTMAFAKAPVRLTSPLLFLAVIFGTIADYFVWHQVLDHYSFIGMGFIILGGCLAIYFGQKEFITPVKS
jgi:drug/metabolite transporter (DMT)-like permease